MLAGAAHLKPLYTPSDSMATNIRPCLSAVAVLQDLLHLSGRQQLAGELVARGAVGLAAAAARTSGQQTWCVAGSCGPSSADDACKLIPATTAVWVVPGSSVLVAQLLLLLLLLLLHAHLRRASLVCCAASCWMLPISCLPSSVSSRCGRPGGPAGWHCQRCSAPVPGSPSPHCAAAAASSS
jgi:hypothetical protein